MNTVSVPIKFVSNSSAKLTALTAKERINKAVVGEAYLFSMDGRKILYSPLDKLILELDDELSNLLIENQIQAFWKRSIDPYGELGLFQNTAPSVEEYIVEDSYDGIILLMNNLCNMGCEYCYAGDVQKQQTETIQEELWNSILKYVFENLKDGVKEFTVGFHGYGECTVEFDKIIAITNLVTSMASKCGVIPKFSVTTNGTFSEKECEWMINEGFRFNLSLDGKKEVNDLMRKSRGGKSFHTAIERNVKLIAKNQDKSKLHIRATVTRDTTERMVESLEYFAHLGAKSVQFEPITPRGSAVDLSSDGSVDMQEFSNQMKKCIVRASELGITLRYGPLNFGIAVRFCSSKSKLTVDYKGRMLSCLQAGPDSGLDFFHYGDINKHKDVEIRKNKLDAINSFSVYDSTSCQTCLLKYHCSGDCKAQDFDLSIYPGYKSNKCAHNEELFAWSLKEIATGNRAQSILDFEIIEV